MATAASRCFQISTANVLLGSAICFSHLPAEPRQKSRLLASRLHSTSAAGGNNALPFRRNQLVSTSLSFSATDPCPSHAAARAEGHPVMEWTSGGGFSWAAGGAWTSQSAPHPPTPPLLPTYATEDPRAASPCPDSNCFITLGTELGYL